MHTHLTDTRFTTIHINIWSPPGVGRGALAHNLQAIFDENGYSSHLVQDYAHELLLQRKLSWLDAGTSQIKEHEQFLITSEQYRRQSELDGKVQFLITEAPLMQQALFAPDTYAFQLMEIVNNLSIGWVNLDFYITGPLKNHYKPNSRIQSHEDAADMDEQIRATLGSYRPEFITAEMSTAKFRIFEIAKMELKKYIK